MPFDSLGSSFDGEISDLEKYIKWVANILNEQKISEAQANSNFNRDGQSLVHWLQREKEQKEWLRDLHRDHNRRSGIKY